MCLTQVIAQAAAWRGNYLDRAGRLRLMFQTVFLRSARGEARGYRFCSDGVTGFGPLGLSGQCLVRQPIQ